MPETPEMVEAPTMRGVADKYLHSAARRRREVREGRYREPRPMTGFWSSLTEEQRQGFHSWCAALPPSEDPIHG